MRTGQELSAPVDISKALREINDAIRTTAQTAPVLVDFEGHPALYARHLAPQEFRHYNHITHHPPRLRGQFVLAALFSRAHGEDVEPYGVIQAKQPNLYYGDPVDLDFLSDLTFSLKLDLWWRPANSVTPAIQLRSKAGLKLEHTNSNLGV